MINLVHGVCLSRGNVDFDLKTVPFSTGQLSVGFSHSDNGFSCEKMSFSEIENVKVGARTLTNDNSSHSVRKDRGNANFDI